MNKTLSEQLCEICGIKPEQKTLPDFTKPENFVKLLEIMTDQTTKERLLRFVKLLRAESGDFINDRIQAIRKADWDWEQKNG